MSGREIERMIDTETASQIETLARDRIVPIGEAWGERNETCKEIVEVMAEAGLFALNLSPEDGGTGQHDQYSTLLCHIRETLGYYSPVGDMSFALQGLGTGSIVTKGSAEIKARYLPGLVSGETLFAFGLSEPEGSSDVLRMRTSVRRDGEDWILTGQKMFVSGSPDADVYVVFARNAEGIEPAGITAFVLEKGTPGFTARGDIELAAPHAIGYLDFDECRIPDTQRIGEIGAGMSVALGTLEIYRPSVGAFAIGMARRATDLAVEFAGGRQAFGRPLLAHRSIRIKIGRMVAMTLAGRALVRRAATLRDAGQKTLVEAAMAKLFSTEAAFAVIYESQQIHGGRGVMKGYAIEELSRDIRATTIYEGTSEIQRRIIGRSERKRASPAATLQSPSVTGASDAPGGAGISWARAAYESLLSFVVGAASLVDDDAVLDRLADVAMAVCAAEALSATPEAGDGYAAAVWSESVRVVAWNACASVLDAATSFTMGAGTDALEQLAEFTPGGQEALASLGAGLEQLVGNVAEAYL
jgi:acyl-CoA dehydrogenase